jgi:hypothetical protein
MKGVRKMTPEQIKKLKQGDKIYSLEDENTSTIKMPDFKWRELKYDSADIEENKVHFKVYVRYEPGFVKSLDEEDIKLYFPTKEEAIKAKIEYCKKEINENEIYEKRDFIGLFSICANKMNDYYKKCIACLEQMLNPPKPTKMEMLEEIAKPIEEFLKKYGNPYTTIIATQDHIQLLEGSIGIPFKIED